MDSKQDHGHAVHREWLPAFAIVWISLASLLVFLRLTLRITGRNGALGLDDVRASVLSAQQASNRGTGSTSTFLDHLHSFHKRCDLCIKLRIYRSAYKRLTALQLWRLCTSK
jgi:hypothetical protein